MVSDPAEDSPETNNLLKPLEDVGKESLSSVAVRATLVAKHIDVQT